MGTYPLHVSGTCMDEQFYSCQIQYPSFDWISIGISHGGYVFTVFWCCWTDNKFKSLQLIPVAYLRVFKIRTSFKWGFKMRVQTNPNPTSRVSRLASKRLFTAEIRVTQLRSAHVAVLAASHKALPLPGVNRLNRSRRNRGSGGSASLREQLLKNLPGSNHVTRKYEKNILGKNQRWKIKIRKSAYPKSSGNISNCM